VSEPLDHNDPHVRCLQRIARCRAKLEQINGILRVYQRIAKMSWGDSGNLAEIESALGAIIENNSEVTP
jgi:hypothetical protein